MINYLKSEWYRIIREKMMFVLMAVMSFLPTMMNVALFLFKQNGTGVQYATVAFSLSFLTNSLHILFPAGALVVAMLFSEDKKNGTIKNNIAYGISRVSIFTGKCIIGFIWSLAILIVVVFSYIVSAYLLLDYLDLMPLQMQLKGIAVALPSALASVVLTVAISVCVVI